MTQQEPQVPLVAYVMKAVHKRTGGPERFVVRKGGVRLVEAATRALLLSPASEDAQRVALKKALAVAHALGTKFASPTASQALIEAVSTSSKAANLLGLENQGLRKRQRNIARFLGASSIRRAPAHQPPAPIGTLRLSTMLVARTREYR